MTSDILDAKPVRYLDFWKVHGDPPLCTITVRGISGVYDLDEVSSFIWLHLDGTNSVNWIITEICNNFEGAEKKQVGRDIIEILKSWEEDDLIILYYTPLYPYKEMKTLKKIRKNN